MVLLIGVMAITTKFPGYQISAGLTHELSPLLVGILVWSIGMSLGGPTGYAINPARDLAPRIAHFLLPIAGKGDSNWKYSWIPVVGPIIGGIYGGVFYYAVFHGTITWAFWAFSAIIAVVVIMAIVQESS